MLHHLFARHSQPVLPIEAERVVLREAHAGDIEAVARLELLDSHRLSHRDLVVAEADGELIAAVDRRSSTAVADPFLPSAGVATLLRTWAAAR